MAKRFIKGMAHHAPAFLTENFPIPGKYSVRILESELRLAGIDALPADQSGKREFTFVNFKDIHEQNFYVESPSAADFQGYIGHAIFRSVCGFHGRLSCHFRRRVCAGKWRIRHGEN
jgi:hypothetical protein